MDDKTMFYNRDDVREIRLIYLFLGFSAGVATTFLSLLLLGWLLGVE